MNEEEMIEKQLREQKLLGNIKEEISKIILKEKGEKIEVLHDQLIQLMNGSGLDLETLIYLIELVKRKLMDEAIKYYSVQE